MAPTPETSTQHARAAAVGIVRTLRDAGHTAYFAGGCVRDELLGLEPTDYDVATDATPDRLRAIFPRASEVGAHFGVMLVKVGREVVEVATFRSDGSYSDQRRPDSVTFSDPVQDAQRRDFTVNAMFLDPLAPAGAQVIDYVGGQEDLRARVLRAVGEPDRRLAEDHLRALRAVRLASKLGFELAPGTAAAITRHAADLRGVSRERIGDELRRVLAHPSRGRAVELLASLGLEAPVLLIDRSGSEGVSGRSARVLRGLPEGVSLGAALAAWALDGGHPPEAPEKASTQMVSRWRSALCLSNDEAAAMTGVLAVVRALRVDWEGKGEPGWRVARQKRLAAGRWFGEGLAVTRALDPELAERVEARVRELAATPPGIAPTPLLTGDDLVAMGFKPGPGFKRALDGVYDAQLEGKIGTLEAARELAARLIVS